MQTSKLKQLKTDGEWIKDEASGHHVFHVNNHHAFVQAAGYLKHTHGKEGQSVVAFRGQTQLFPELRPSLYRGAKNQKQKQTKDRKIFDLLKVVDRGILSDIETYAREPLLQHYGFRTRWIDLVDNVWVALWFACHNTRCAGRLNEHLHFERRRTVTPFLESGDTASTPKIAALQNVEQFAYVILVRVDISVGQTEPGLYRGRNAELIDLRIAAPSHFLRPHSQCGLLFRRAKEADHLHMDNQEFICGILRVRLPDAFEWLGDGKLVSIHSLFPPATFDHGYRRLLDKGPKGNETVGAVQIIGP